MRTKPEQKPRIIKEFQRCKNSVGMTADGVNDAPSVKAADIGIAMGSGSDTVSQAVDTVLLKRLPRSWRLCGMHGWFTII